MLEYTEYIPKRGGINFGKNKGTLQANLKEGEKREIEFKNKDLPGGACSAHITSFIAELCKV